MSRILGRRIVVNSQRRAPGAAAIGAAAEHNVDQVPRIIGHGAKRIELSARGPRGGPAGGCGWKKRFCLAPRVFGKGKNGTAFSGGGRWGGTGGFPRAETSM